MLTRRLAAVTAVTLVCLVGAATGAGAAAPTDPSTAQAPEKKLPDPMPAQLLRVPENRGPLEDQTKGRATPPRRRTAKPCTLKPSEKHEWASCLAIKATVDRAPRVGEETTLTVEVKAEKDLENIRVEVDLPAALTWRATPDGMTTEAGHGALTTTLKAGRTTTYKAKITADAAGPVEIVARAVGDTREKTPGDEAAKPDDAPPASDPASTPTSDRASDPATDRGKAESGGASAASDVVALTVGGDDTAARLGVAVRNEFGVAKADPGVRVEVPALEPAQEKKAALARERARERKAAPDGKPEPTVPDGDQAPAAASGKPALTAGPGQACATGRWVYVDEKGVTRPSRMFGVEIWDADTGSEDDLLATGLTDSQGNYWVCFGTADADEPGDTVDVWVRFTSANDLARVSSNDRPGGYAFPFKAGKADNVQDGTKVDFGTLQPAGDFDMRVPRAFEAAMAVWYRLPTLCWDADDAVCRQVTLYWYPGSQYTYYSPSSDSVYLSSLAPDVPFVVAHEVGHALMDDVYEDRYPATPGCDPHDPNTRSSAGCAWVEGWADWLAATVVGEPVFRSEIPYVTPFDLEDQPTWGLTDQWGDEVEARVAGALIDITDDHADGFDTYGEAPFGNVWATFNRHVSNTFREFWDHRKADGFDVSEGGALASLYQNTIDYGYRPRLADYTPLPGAASTTRTFRYDTTTPYWSAVAVLSTNNADHDLRLYDDEGLTAPLAYSYYGPGTIDFVVVDGNQRPAGDYYPQVTRYSGDERFIIMLAQGKNILEPGESTTTLTDRWRPIEIRDTWLQEGETATFTFTPGWSRDRPYWGQAELLVFGSGSDPGTWVQPRSNALAYAYVGDGQDGKLTFTARQAGWYGLVAVLKSGAGGYATISRS